MLALCIFDRTIPWILGFGWFGEGLVGLEGGLALGGWGKGG